MSPEALWEDGVAQGLKGAPQPSASTPAHPLPNRSQVQPERPGLKLLLCGHCSCWRPLGLPTPPSPAGPAAYRSPPAEPCGGCESSGT